MPYVNQRWLGGMLTNFQTVYKRLQRLKELEAIEQTGGQTVLSKKEALMLSRERIKLTRTLGGIRDMTRVPSAVWIVDTKKEHIAVGEARKLGIPVVAILDTNCDPDEVDYPIPGNDDAIRSVDLLTRVVADAVAEGLMARAGASRGDEKPASGELATDEPLADWERELLEGATAGAAARPSRAQASTLPRRAPPRPRTAAEATPSCRRGRAPPRPDRSAPAEATEHPSSRRAAGAAGTGTAVPAPASAPARATRTACTRAPDTHSSQHATERQHDG